MRSFSYLAFLAGAASAAPSLDKRAPTVYLAGDSTMAEKGGNNGATEGWGHYLQYSLSIPVVNNAIGGRSARSFTVESRFDAIAANVKSGDFVIIEFGHNDGGSLTPTDNGRTDCPGAGSETCTSTYNGQTVIVQTYPTYITNAGKLFTAKGAHVIISSPTPNNPWETGTFTYTPNRFTDYSKASAAAVGSLAEFVDHGQYTANIFKTLGNSVVTTYYPTDHTHTSPNGADTVAKAFVKGAACGNTALAAYIKNSTSTIQGSCI